MISEEAIRFLVYEARRCRTRDSAEALCLLLPSMAQLLCVEPMDDFEANAFKFQMRRELETQEFLEAMSHD